MEEETGEMHSDEDKALSDKNKKRKVKTRAQIQALEKFYQDQKYPTESMKTDLACSIGLTEKQISGWFCHRRLKDKRLMKQENNGTTQKQDRSSGVVVQDSCGSTKQTCDKQIDTREVESGRLTPKYTGNYDVATNGSSGSSSSLRDMYDNGQNNDNPVRVPASRYPVPRFPVDQGIVKPRTGPSGYLKVKSRVENPAITAVKQQLGKHYRVDGPPLAVEFDPLPPDAFESTMQDRDDDETYYTEEAALPTSNNTSQLRHIPKSDEGCDYNSKDQTSFRMKHGNDNHQDHRHYTNINSSIEFNEGSDRVSPSGRNREEYEMRHSRGIKVSRMHSSSNCHTQPTFEEVRNERTESSLFQKYKGEGMKVSHGENLENEYNYLKVKGTKYKSEGMKISTGQNMENEYDYITMKRNEYDGSGDKVPYRKMIKEAEKYYPERSTISERRVKMKNDFNAPERKWEVFSPLQQSKVSSIPRFRPENPPQFEDDDDAETDSSAD